MYFDFSKLILQEPQPNKPPGTKRKCNRNGEISIINVIEAVKKDVLGEKLQNNLRFLSFLYRRMQSIETDSPYVQREVSSALEDGGIIDNSNSKRNSNEKCSLVMAIFD